MKSPGDLVTQCVTLLEWDSLDVVGKAAAVVAALAKTESGRNACSCPCIILPLLRLLSSHTDNQLLIQTCRALGNICYENCEFFYTGLVLPQPPFKHGADLPYTCLQL